MLPRGPLPLTAGFEQELAYIAYDDEGDEIYEEVQVRAELRRRDKAQSWVGKQVRNTGGSPPAKRVKGGPMPPAATEAEPVSLTDEWPIEEFHAFLASSQEKIAAASFAQLEAEDAKKLIEAIPAPVRKQFKLPTTLAEYKVLSRNAASTVAALESMVAGVIAAWVSHVDGPGPRPAAKWGINGALEDVGLLKLLAEDPDYLLQREPWQVLPRGPLPLTAVFEQELAYIGRFMLPVEATCLREIKVDELAPPHVPRGVPKDWLRVRLDNNRTIYPRIDNTDASKWETSYHGTRWLQALNVLKQRLFDFGYRCTAKKSGVWHAAMPTAVKYALPCKWTGSDLHTQAVFEISISRKTKHGPAFCTQDPRCYQVEAILLGRYEGPASLKGFHHMDLGEELNAEAVMSCIR